MRGERRTTINAPYYQAARFPSKQKAGETYFPLQQMIFVAKDDCDLSVYRYKSMRKNMWYVVVVGEKPPVSLHIAIEAQLTNGTLTTLDAGELTYLMERRSEAIQLGPWVEGHYHDSEEER